jgi:hypothetical protein
VCTTVELTCQSSGKSTRRGHAGHKLCSL